MIKFTLNTRNIDGADDVGLVQQLPKVTINQYPVSLEYTISGNITRDVENYHKLTKKVTDLLHKTGILTEDDKRYVRKFSVKIIDDERIKPHLKIDLEIKPFREEYSIKVKSAV